MPKFKPNNFYKMKSPYNFGAADKTLVEGANTAPVKEKEPANEMGNKRYNKLASKAEQAIKEDKINKNERLVKKANKLNKRKDLGKDDIAFGMSAYNLKAIPEDAKGLKKMAQSEKGAAQVKEFGYDPATAMKAGPYQMKYHMVNRQGFEMAGSPKHMSAYLQTQGGETTKETNKKKTETKTTISGGTETNYGGGGKFKNKEEKAWYDNQIKQRTDKGMSQEQAIQDYRNTFKIGEKKETKLPDQVVTDVKLDPIMEEKRMFNPTEQRQRGQMSLQAGRQSKREGIQDLVAQKAGLKTALKSNIDKVKNQEFGSRKDRRQAIKAARKLKRGAMKSFKSGNFTGLQDRIVNAGVTDTRGFNAGDATLARRQAQGIDKSVRYYDTQSAIDKRVGFGGTYQDNQRQTQAGADFQAEINPFSATNSLMNRKLNSGFGNFMKKGGYRMKGSPYNLKK